MDNLFPLILNTNSNKKLIDEISGCNEKIKEHGIVISSADVSAIIASRNSALTKSGRIEFSGSIVPKMILLFSDSPYVFKENFVETIDELVEMFFYYKNETLDLISDESLLKWMKIYFNNSCKGSLELLKGRELDKLAHNVRNGCFDFEDYNDIADNYCEADDEE